MMSTLKDTHSTVKDMTRMAMNKAYSVHADCSCLRVPGGWIYTTSSSQGIAATFVPEPK